MTLIRNSFKTTEYRGWYIHSHYEQDTVTRISTEIVQVQQEGQVAKYVKSMAAAKQYITKQVNQSR